MTRIDTETKPLAAHEEAPTRHADTRRCVPPTSRSGRRVGLRDPQFPETRNQESGDVAPRDPKKSLEGPRESSQISVGRGRQTPLVFSENLKLAKFQTTENPKKGVENRFLRVCR